MRKDRKVIHHKAHAIATQLTNLDGGKHQLRRGETLRVLKALKVLDKDGRVRRWLRDSKVTKR